MFHDNIFSMTGSDESFQVESHITKAHDIYTVIQLLIYTL